MLPERLAAAGVRGPAVGQLLREGHIVVGDRRVALDEVSVQRRGQSVAFVMDTRRCDNAVELARDVDLLICESTYLDCDADKAHEHGHLTAAQAATIARTAGARKLVLTHFSQRYTSTEPFVAEASPIFPEVVAASDGDTIAVPPRRP
jgi:ribonuclease Z